MIQEFGADVYGDTRNGYIHIIQLKAGIFR
jgi:hypothetical protein